MRDKITITREELMKYLEELNKRRLELELKLNNIDDIIRSNIVLLTNSFYTEKEKNIACKGLESSLIKAKSNIINIKDYI